MKFQLKFTTDYGQFYVNDKNANGNTNSDNFWTEQAFEDKLAVEDGVLGIGIANSEGLVDCTFEILNSKKSAESAQSAGEKKLAQKNQKINVDAKC